MERRLFVIREHRLVTVFCPEHAAGNWTVAVHRLALHHWDKNPALHVVTTVRNAEWYKGGFPAQSHEARALEWCYRETQ